jgi:hypothetical protein
MRFELHIEGQIFDSDDWGELKNLGEKMVFPYVIYGFAESKMNIWTHIPRTATNTKGIQKKDLPDIENMLYRGITRRAIAKKYGMNADTLTRKLKAFNIYK